MKKAPSTYIIILLNCSGVFLSKYINKNSQQNLHLIRQEVIILNNNKRKSSDKIEIRFVT